VGNLRISGKIQIGTSSWQPSTVSFFEVKLRMDQHILGQKDHDCYRCNSRCGLTRTSSSQSKIFYVFITSSLSSPSSCSLTKGRNLFQSELTTEVMQLHRTAHLRRKFCSVFSVTVCTYANAVYFAKFFISLKAHLILFHTFEGQE